LERIMAHPVRLAVAGVGNNISALLQGVHYYRDLQEADAGDELPGVTHPVLEGFGVSEVEIVAAFDIATAKIGQDVVEAIFTPPNNYPRIAGELRPSGTPVHQGLTFDDGRVQGVERVTDVLQRSGAEVLLYSLPTGLQWALDGYAHCAAAARTGLVNCTPESAARNSELMTLFQSRSLPLLGDDLASQFGASVVHRTLLNMLVDRGLDLTSSYQLNIGGNEDFRNLREHGGSKLRSKLNALNLRNGSRGRVEVIPSAGYLVQLGDHKISMMNIEGRGWGGTEVAIDLRLKVQDSSNAAGVIIDLIRIAAGAMRHHQGGFSELARMLLKSPPACVTHGAEAAMA
jgi:myo-inositol-1-phosphate synthase